MESGIRIKPAATVHVDAETVPVTGEIAICLHYSYWFCFGNWCPFSRNVCVLGVQGRTTPSESSVGGEVGQGGDQSEHYRLRTFRKQDDEGDSG